MADRLDFEIDIELETGLITGHAGVPGLIEAFRQTGTAAVIDREVKLKSRRRGLGATEVVESLLAMWAAGGERTEDLDQFRQDKALALLLERGRTTDPCLRHWRRSGFVGTVHRLARQRGDCGPAGLSPRDPHTPACYVRAR